MDRRGEGNSRSPIRGPDVEKDDLIMPLTDVVIRNAKPCSRPFKMGDFEGLFLLMQPTGGNLWRLK